MVKSAPEQQLELQAFIVATEITDHIDDGCIEQSHQKFDLGEAAEVLREVLGVLRDRMAVEIGDAEVEENIEEVGEVEKGLVCAVRCVAKQVLYLTVDAENPEGLHQQVEKQQENDIFDEAVLHGCVVVSEGKSRKKNTLKRFSASILEIMRIFTPKFD